MVNKLERSKLSSLAAHWRRGGLLLLLLLLLQVVEY